jgi:hypothetical protein
MSLVSLPLKWPRLVLPLPLTRTPTGCESLSAKQAKVVVPPDDLPLIVDTLQEGALVGRGIVEGGVNPVSSEEAVALAAADVIPDNLPEGINVPRHGGRTGHGIVEGGVSASDQEKAVCVVAGVGVLADDLPRPVDAVGRGAGAGSGQRIIDGAVSAAAQEEAVKMVAAVDILPDNLARVIDVTRTGHGGGQGIVDGGVGLDWHDTDSSACLL